MLRAERLDTVTDTSLIADKALLLDTVMRRTGAEAGQMPLVNDKALLLDDVMKRYGRNRARDDLLAFMRRGIAEYYTSNPTKQERLMRALQYSFVEFEQSRTGNGTLTYTDVQVRFRQRWIQAMRPADYNANRSSIPSPIVEVP